MGDILTFTVTPTNPKDISTGTRWLSNFAPCKVKLDNKTYPNVEQAYQASKNTSDRWRSYCQKAQYPQTCKKLSHSSVLVHREDWNDETKVKVMRKLLEQKFSQEPYKQLLLDTGVCHIEEGNYWKDYFWGVDIETRQGKNVLGELIMDIRADLNKNNKTNNNIIDTNF